MGWGYPLAVVIYLVLMVVSMKVVIVGVEYSAKRSAGLQTPCGGSGYGGVSLPVNTLASIGDSAIVHPMPQVMRHTDLDALGVATKGEHHGYA